jgi:hypothetical protein
MAIPRQWIENRICGIMHDIAEMQSSVVMSIEVAGFTHTDRDKVTDDNPMVFDATLFLEWGQR